MSAIAPEAAQRASSPGSAGAANRRSWSDIRARRYGPVTAPIASDAKSRPDVAVKSTQNRRRCHGRRRLMASCTPSTPASSSSCSRWSAATRRRRSTAPRSWSSTPASARRRPAGRPAPCPSSSSGSSTTTATTSTPAPYDVLLSRDDPMLDAAAGRRRRAADRRRCAGVLLRGQRATLGRGRAGRGVGRVLDAAVGPRVHRLAAGPRRVRALPPDDEPPVLTDRVGDGAADRAQPAASPQRRHGGACATDWPRP